MAEPIDPSGPQIDLLLRYIAGRATAAEAEDVVRWAAARPERARMLKTLEQAFELRAPVADTIPEASNADAVWDRLAARLPAPAAEVEEARPLVLHRRVPTAPVRSASARFRPWLRAAVVLAAVGAGFGLWQLGARKGGGVTDPRAARDYHEYTTRPGERASFMLPDGTQVMLSVASRLRVPNDYGKTRRTVVLEGEAYFEVRHDAGRRFLVYHAHGVTEDLGTRFDVRDYAGDTVAQVVVAEGRVTLQAGNSARPAKSVILTVGQLGRTTSDGAVVMRGDADLGQHLAWLEGRLVLRNVPLRDALPQLSRWYDLDFQIGDSTIADARISATLTNQPIADALDLLGVTLGVGVERDGRTVVLHAKTMQMP